MTRDETIALFLKGHDAWNAWANDMLEKRKLLEEAGEWTNYARYNWEDLAYADFSSIQLDLRPSINQKEVDNINELRAKLQIKQTDKCFLVPDGPYLDFPSFHFPGDVSFKHSILVANLRFINCLFHGQVDLQYCDFLNNFSLNECHFQGSFYFEPGRIENSFTLRNCTFKADCTISMVSIGGYANFKSNKFGGKTKFQCLQVVDECAFADSVFCGEADFRWSEFGSNCDFSEVNFKQTALFGSLERAFDKSLFPEEAPEFIGYANFSKTIFEQDCVFDDLTFANEVNFGLANFCGRSSFHNVLCRKTADFQSIRSERSFSLSGATFKKVPDFSEADFHAPPVLDDIKLPDYPIIASKMEKNDPRPEWSQGVIGAAWDKNDHTKYRWLRKFAKEAGDFRLSIDLLADELRCRRFWKDKPGFGNTFMKFWVGVFFQILSDFGRSVWRPIIGLFIFGSVFASLYWFLANDTGTIWNAIFLSLRNGLIVSGLNRTGALQDRLINLYGDGDIPGSVATLMMLQTVISVMFFFLLGLALRNMFKSS